MKRKRFNIGYFYAIATGVICAIVPIIFQKVMTQEPIPRATALFIKFFTSSLILLPFVAPKFKKVQYPQGFGWKLPVCAFLFVATLVLLYESYRYIPPAIGVSLQYTFPLFTMGFSVLFFRFRRTKQNVAAMLLSLAGVMLLSSESLTSHKSYIGIILAIASAVVYAAYFLWTEHQRLAAMDATVYVTLKTCFSTAFLLLYILVTHQFTLAVSLQTVLGLALSGVGTILASFCLTLAIWRIGSVYTSILGSIELIVVAIATMLAIADDETIAHPELEFLCTTQEETGLIGIRNADLSVIKSRRMINLDSGSSHEICVSAVGAKMVSFEKTFDGCAKEGLTQLHLNLFGGLGGHAGTLAHKNRACCINIMGELLHMLSRRMPVYLAEIIADGPSMCIYFPVVLRISFLLTAY